MTDRKPVQDIIIHIADIHFWQAVCNPIHLLNKRFWGNLTVWMRRRHEFVLERAKPYSDTILATGIKSAVLTGDFCSTATPNEYRQATRFVNHLHDQGLKIHMVAGNHDLYTFSAARTHRFERYMADFLPPEGYPARVDLPGGTPLLLVPTAVPHHFSSRGLLTQETAARVTTLLAECGPQVIVAAHYPLLHRTHGYISGYFRQLENAEILRQILGKSGKQILYIAGHVHRFSLQTDAQYPNLTHLTTSTFLRTSPATHSEGEFSEIHVLNDGFRVFRHLYQNGWIRTPEQIRPASGL